MENDKNCNNCHWNVNGACEITNGENSKPIADPTKPDCGYTGKSLVPTGFMPILENTMDWQPLETAPTKGAKVLAACRHTRIIRFVWPSELEQPASDGSSFFKAWAPVTHPDDAMQRRGASNATS